MRRWGWVAAAAVALASPGCSLLRSRPAPPPTAGGVQVGLASWYGPGFHGNATASGEIFDQNDLTAAHPSLPLGTRTMVTSLTNDRAVEVRINDRGPFVDGRIIDLSYAAARRIRMIGPGTMRVRVEVLEPPRHPPAVARRRTPQPDDAPAGRVAPEASGPEPRAAANAWVVQLGTFSRREAAEELQREVARRFPEAQVSRVDTGTDRPYRVRLGPYGARRSAEARAEILSRLGYPAAILDAPVTR